MVKQRKILVGLPEEISKDIEEIITSRGITRSKFIREALCVYIKEIRRHDTEELMKKGYKEMGDINLQLAEFGTGEPD